MSTAGMTVAEVALMYGVSVQTVRGWVSEGAPVIRTGRQGGPGSIIDATRFPGWLFKRRHTDESMGERLMRSSMPCGGNILRWLAELHLQHSTNAIGTGLRHWYESEGWRAIGLQLSDEQARALTWRVFQVVALYMSVNTFDKFDTQLQEATEADLDSWASLLFKADFQTKWTDQDTITAGANIAELRPEDERPPQSKKGNL